MKKIFILLIFVFLFSCATEKNYQGNFNVTSQPSFQVDYAMPTADKPQSKLWFMADSWWAILPGQESPTLWQRTRDGWKEYPEIKSALHGVPGRADVWAENDRVTAVGVGDSSLTVFSLEYLPEKIHSKWLFTIHSMLYPPSAGTIETATIARDGKGNWWVAATSNSKVCVWYSNSEATKWSSPNILAEKLDEDDICTISPLKGGVGVIWSDQVRDAVLMRVHKDEMPTEIWGEEEIADLGNKTADDHLNTVLTSDATLWLTTKNSVDQPGRAQFVLRIRTKDGIWKNIPYLVLENRMKRPSRPIVLATEDNSYIFLGHGDNDRSVPYPYNSEIEFSYFKPNSFTQGKLNITYPVIVPDSTYKYVVHNVTGPKKPFPASVPWIVLASDSKGNVFETDLKKLVKHSNR